MKEYYQGSLTKPVSDKPVWIHYGNVNCDIDIHATTEENAREMLAELLDKLNNS